MCGSNLISKFDAKPSVYGLALGVLDDDPQVRPVCHLYVGSKAPWFEITDSLPQYETLPPGVDKAEEPGNDASTAAPPGIMPVVIRAERPDDAAAIDEVTRQAFASHPHSRQTEQFIVRALRAAGALAVSLVAERSGRVVGHIAFSPVALSDASVGWFGMGPVSVLPSAQRQGIGRSLIEHGLSLLRERGAAGCVLVGEPSFYSRFGFAEHPGLLLPGVPQEFFLALPFGPALPQGEVTFHAAFSAER